MFINTSQSLRYDQHGRKRKTKSLSTSKRKYDRKDFKPYVGNKTTLDELREAQAKQYKSVMEEAMKDGSWVKLAGGTARRESPKYTGTLVKGIATMHKSNAVPVINDQEAKDIARMRRG